jgi:hypothetical protein
LHYAKAYEETADELRRLLSNVTNQESAQTFVDHATRYVKEAAATTPEYYLGEFYGRFRTAIADEINEEMARCEQEPSQIESAHEAAVTELNGRLREARAAANQEAEHTIWGDAEQMQAASQAAVEAVMQRMVQCHWRLRAAVDLGPALGFPHPTDLQSSRESNTAEIRQTASVAGSQQYPHVQTAAENKVQRPSRASSTFWIYDNVVHRFSKIHRGECAFCNHGEGIHNRGDRAVAGTWLGPFDDFADALAAADSTGRQVQTCSVCVPC